MKYTPQKYRYNHVFAFLAPIDGVEFKFTAQHNYETEQDGPITIYMPLSKYWSTSTGGSGFCALPLEGIGNCAGGQDVVDKLLAKLVRAIARAKID